MANPTSKYLSPSVVARIFEQVSTETGVTIPAIQSRQRQFYRERWLVMQAMRNRGASLPTIGQYLGKHHTTVLHGLRQLEREAV